VIDPDPAIDKDHNVYITSHWAKADCINIVSVISTPKNRCDDVEAT
jgi:hypothetical protein